MKIYSFKTYKQAFEFYYLCWKILIVWKIRDAVGIKHAAPGSERKST